MAQILMLVNQFSHRDEPADPPHQLADAFVAQGHSVKVVVIPWQRAEVEVTTYAEHDRLQVLRVPPFQPKSLGRIGSLLLRWTFSSFAARRHAKKFLHGSAIDLIYTTSPAVTMAFLIRWALRRFAARSYLYVVDFFPFHQRAIGLIPDGPLFRFALRQETALIRKFNVIGCMSPKNVDYLRGHYSLRATQKVEILPLSTGIVPTLEVDVNAVRSRYSLPSDKIVALFGGQISEGRGIEQLIDVARLAKQAEPNLHFVLAGSGRLTYLVEEYIAAAGENLTLISNLARDDYLQMAASCDIGLVITVPIADIPTFPSKTLDYLQASLPIVAAVESGTDFRDFVNQHGFGLVVEAGDREELLNALVNLVSNAGKRHDMGRAGRETLVKQFSVDKAAAQILDKIPHHD